MKHLLLQKHSATSNHVADACPPTLLPSLWRSVSHSVTGREGEREREGRARKAHDFLNAAFCTEAPAELALPLFGVATAGNFNQGPKP